VFASYRHHRHLHSFPTRRSSDLTALIRIAIDIGGTFTDVVAEREARQWAVKVLTTPGAPEQAVLEGVRAILEAAGSRAADVAVRSEEHTSELQSRGHLVCRLLLE